MYIPLILGTSREGRLSEPVAKFVLEQMKAHGFDSELIDIRDYLGEAKTKAMESAKADKWKDVISRADGFVMVVPEYNHSYPGELKMFLDQFYDEYLHKPVGVCGVSVGGFGGVRVIDAMNTLLVTLKMIPVPYPVPFTKAGELFDEEGKIKEDRYEASLTKMFDELSWFAEKLK